VERILKSEGEIWCLVVWIWASMPDMVELRTFLSSQRWNTHVFRDTRVYVSAVWPTYNALPLSSAEAIGIGLHEVSQSKLHVRFM
jgi:hypothetical protein